MRLKLTFASLITAVLLALALNAASGEAEPEEVVTTTTIVDDVPIQYYDLVNQLLPTPTTTTSTTTTTHYHPPKPQPAKAYSGTSVWDDLAWCESRGDWGYGPHSNWGSHLFEGGLQWKHSTWLAWKAPGDPEHAYDASREQEIAAAERLRAYEVASGRGGFNPWPSCATKLGLPR